MSKYDKDRFDFSSLGETRVSIVMDGGRTEIIRHPGRTFSRRGRKFNRGKLYIRQEGNLSLERMSRAISFLTINKKSI